MFEFTFLSLFLIRPFINKQSNLYEFDSIFISSYIYFLYVDCTLKYSIVLNILLYKKT